MKLSEQNKSFLRDWIDYELSNSPILSEHAKIMMEQILDSLNKE